MLFAGSRHLEVAESTCGAVVEGFGHLGFSYCIGCAPGVDLSFRQALAGSIYAERCFVACAFPSRTAPANCFGLFASVVVPGGLPPHAALRRRTLWCVKRCELLVLFAENPHDHNWGRGSQLAFRAALYQLKPIFVVSSRTPQSSPDYRVLPATLFGAVKGWWVVPYPVEQGGPCDEQY